jgi:hypothetical protein
MEPEMILDFVSAGAKLRSTASAMSQEAAYCMDEARRRCKDAEHATRTQLAELDELRRQVSGELVGAYPLYRLAGLHNLGLAAEGDANRLPPVAVDAASLPAAPSASRWLAGGALGGGAIGAVSVFVAGLVAPLGWAVGIVSGGLMAIALAGLVQGRKAVAVAHEQQRVAQQWQERAASHVRQFDRIRKGATLSMQLTTVRERRLRLHQSELEDIAFDTTNAAKLLKDVLNTALLDEEGAFLDGVIQELHGQKERIAGFAGRIAAEA